ncbi:hypothetical protein Tsubulata_022597 [Turnera subulata]|uniref:Uncharacterized protein n=1 Tax=Turnera subulata TaxID=218843 RepID=A0A9Q0FSW1_9ROSI|nr:hypothetical protein Tsubulata_022597 [Turnera subulata]
MKASSRFQNPDPDDAHVYVLRFCVVLIISHTVDPIISEKAVLDGAKVYLVHASSMLKSSRMLWDEDISEFFNSEKDDHS